MMKTYNAIFLALVFLIVSISAAIMLWSQPTSGDLTRISAYPERWFGWNDPQQDIPPVINTPRQTGKFHILVIGDSFSEAGHWQSLLSNHYSFSFIHSGKTTLADILALQGDKKPDAVVIETPDSVLVASRSHIQKVKDVVNHLKATGRTEAGSSRKVHRPWGWYDSVDAGDRFQVKRIVVKPGAALSLQMHHHRAEHWIVVQGTAQVTRGDQVFLVSENQSTYIPLGEKHRLENPGKLPLEMIEVQSGTYLGEDDIVRFQDVYGRQA